jgi:hypothetical protein
MTTASGHTEVIRAKKVLGTTVKNTAGEKIGTVEDIVLDKLSNNIVESEDSYVVPFTKEQLKAAPADSLEKLTRADSAATYSASANAYYKAH